MLEIEKRVVKAAAKAYVCGIEEESTEEIIDYICEKNTTMDRKEVSELFEKELKQYI